MCFRKADLMTIVLNEFGEETWVKMQPSTWLVSISPMLYNLSALPIA